MPSLKELNLGDNKLSGPVPSSISKNTKLTLEDSGNPNLCATGDSCKTIPSQDDSPTATDSSGTSSIGTAKKSSKLPIILGVAIPVFLLFWGIVIACVCISTNRRKRAAIKGMATGQPGMTNMSNGAQQVVQMMNGSMGDNVGDAVMNQFDQVDVEEQADYQQDAVTPEHIQDQDDRALHY